MKVRNAAYRRDAYDEISILKQIDSEFVIKFFDQFQYNNLNTCGVFEYCEVNNIYILIN